MCPIQMSSCCSRCLRVPIAIRAAYEQILWILQNLLLRNPYFHHGLLAVAVIISHDEAESRRQRAMRLNPKPWRRERSMDKTLADFFPASDPPSTIPTPC